MQNVTHNAIEPVKEAVANGDLSIHAANEIAKLPEEQQEELAAGDLSEVTPKQVKKKKSATSSNFSDTEAKVKPLTIKWDGEIQLEVVKAQLMQLVTDDLREAAMTMKGMEFGCEFAHCKGVEVNTVDGITTNCAFSKITISFSEPEKHENIGTIEIAWQTAARNVQQWIQADAVEKVATSSNFSEDAADQSDSTDSQELDGQVTFTEVIAQEESAANSNLSIELDAREAALLSMTLTGYLSDCAESDSVKDELRGIIRKLDAVITF